MQTYSMGVLFSSTEQPTKEQIMNELTVRELRTLLYDVQNQNMTVRELRTALYNLGGQDEPVAPVLIFGAI
jgi:hypothetical protein